MVLFGRQKDSCDALQVGASGAFHGNYPIREEGEAGQEKTPKSFIAEFKDVVKMSPAGITAFIKENPGKAPAFKKAVADAETSKKALMDWIATRPERNEANNKKFEKFQKDIKAATDKIAAF